VAQASRDVDALRSTLNVAGEDDARQLQRGVVALRATVKSSSEALLNSITSSEGKYEAQAVTDANATLATTLKDAETLRDKALVEMEKLPTAAQKNAALVRLETAFAQSREAAYRELTRSLDEVKKDLHAMAAREAGKIDACAQKNTELRANLEGLKRAHEATLEQLRSDKAALLLAEKSPAPTPIPAPSVAHVQSLFSYMLLHTACAGACGATGPDGASPDAGATVGPDLGATVGPDLGATVGPVAGATVGPVAGATVGPVAGATVGPVAGATVGP
jgi:hypothetical protein